MKINLLAFDNDNILIIKKEDGFSLPTIDMLQLIIDDNSIIEHYRTENELVVTLQQNALNYANQENLHILPTRHVLGQIDYSIATYIAYHQQLHNYYLTHKFCGKCGMVTQQQQQNKFVLCTSCKSEIYPHIAPCVMVRIHKGNQILLARGVNFIKGAWGLIAGFVELGESLEEAIHREVKEEVGITIHNIKYWGSQPWPFQLAHS
jgi:NAD+ diphosphatase